VPRFLVERYLPGVSGAELQAVLDRIAAAAPAMASDGVTWLRSVLVPGDEACVCTYEARDVGHVDAANRRAGLPIDRIVAAIEIRPGTESA